MSNELSIAGKSIDTIAVESMVVRGDVSALTPEQLTAYYLYLCNRYGLDPLLQPFNVLDLNKRKVLYANRGATDTIARNQRIQRTLIKPPHGIEVFGVKLIACVVRATEPNGRYEDRTATVIAQDIPNAMMKSETKAGRRAVLAVTGMGLLDESELHTIRGADEQAEPARRLQLSVCVERALESINSRPELVAPKKGDPLAEKAWNDEVEAFAVEASIPKQQAAKVLSEAWKARQK